MCVIGRFICNELKERLEIDETRRRKDYLYYSIWSHDYVCRPIWSFCSCLSYFTDCLFACVFSVTFYWSIQLYSSASLFNKFTYLLYRYILKFYRLWWQVTVSMAVRHCYHRQLSTVMRHCAILTTLSHHESSSSSPQQFSAPYLLPWTP